MILTKKKIKTKRSDFRFLLPVLEGERSSRRIYLLSCSMCLLSEVYLAERGVKPSSGHLSEAEPSSFGRNPNARFAASETCSVKARIVFYLRKITEVLS